MTKLVKSVATVFVLAALGSTVSSAFMDANAFGAERKGMRYNHSTEGQ